MCSLSWEPLSQYHLRKRDRSVCCLPSCHGECVLLLEYQPLVLEVGQAGRAFLTRCPRRQFSVLNVLVILIYRLTYFCSDISIKVLMRLPSCSYITNFLCTLRFSWFCYLLNRFLFQDILCFLSLEKHFRQNILIVLEYAFFSFQWQAFVSFHCVVSC